MRASLCSGYEEPWCRATSFLLLVEAEAGTGALQRSLLRRGLEPVFPVDTGVPFLKVAQAVADNDLFCSFSECLSLS